jgi:hypothetical protein
VHHADACDRSLADDGERMDHVEGRLVPVQPARVKL